MRLSTILDPRFPMSLRERINRLGEWTVMQIVWSLPRRIVYWTVIRGMVATADGGNPTNITGKQILDHYEGAT
jgi:hypothetical protein